MKNTNVPVIDREQCTLCGTCVELCPEDALGIVDKAVEFTNPNDCTFCTLCEQVCPENAIHCYFEILW